jgi:uncharacterized protein YbjT (DUF2867 family)
VDERAPAGVGTILVTGATGTTGRRVAARLRARGADVRVGGRHPERFDGEPGTAVRFDWHDPGTFAAAVAGVERLYLLRPSGSGADAVDRMHRFLVTARGEGVRRVVLLHSQVTGAAGTPEIPAAVRREMPEWAILCPSWFMQNFTGDHPTATALREHGEIATATGNGRVGFVDADDIAAVATETLLSAEPSNRHHVLTGPETLSYPRIADLVTDITGRRIRYVELTADELTARWVAAGLPEPLARVATELDLAVNRGEYDYTTTAVEDLTGHRPRSFAQFFRSHHRRD